MMHSVLYMETVVFDVSFHIIFFHVPVVLFRSITRISYNHGGKMTVSFLKGCQE